MPEPVEETIRRRVVELLAARPDVTDGQFGAKIGRGYSWVSAFRKGTRHANDIHLLIAIARYFKVSVGYLLGEVESAPDPGAATLLATWDEADPADRRLMLEMLAPLRRRSSGGSPSPQPDAGPGTAEHKGSTRAGPPKPKRRPER